MESPLTRRQRQALTRERLLEVAAEVFAERGYRATSLERIAEQAGFSKGAVYSNFAGKEELVLELLDRHFVHRLDRLQEDLLAAEETIEARVRTISGWWEGLAGEQAWGILLVEFASSTRDNEAVQQQLAARQQMILSFVTGIVEGEIERFDLDLPLSASDVAAVLVSLGSGLAFSRMLAPSVRTGIFAELAEVLLVQGSTPRGERPPPS
jgi:AcrR family transcriptional regulator